MKKLLLLMLIAAFAATINAQTSDKKWGVGMGAWEYGPLGGSSVGVMPELYFGRYVSPKFDLLLQGNMGLWRKGMKSNLDIANGFLNLRYKLYNETKNFRPYLYAGPGYLADNDSEGVNFDLGVGVKYYFFPNFAVYGKTGYIKGIKVAGETENFWNVTAGLEIDFGRSKDSDHDGVPDKKDKCPDTPAGVAVDKKGCPKDSDGDGVADNMDDCPTVAGLPSLKGCPNTDKDGDGVADNIDDCPTVAGLPSLKGCPDKDKDGIADKDDACPDVAGLVALKGCPDSDGDGVADKDDKCPDTKKGMKVDAAGCPADQDKDGVADSEDDCPTVAGTKANRGCPEKQITADQINLQNIEVPAIHFVSGKTYITEYSGNILNNLVTLLNSNKAYHVNIYGYADSQGSNDINYKLSRERIKSAIAYLKSKGIAANRIIQQKAFGEAKPVATNDTSEGRLLNRRVEFEIFIMK